jgi:Flp pilus assembly protein TadB
MLLIAFAVVAFEVFLFIARPNYMGPMFDEPPPIMGWLIPAIGIAAQALGLAWMIRIYRADPEGRRSWFRFTRP